MILNLETGDYFGLRAAGARIWQLLEATRTREEIVSTLVAEFDVEEARLRKDVEEILAKLIAKGLVEQS